MELIRPIQLSDFDTFVKMAHSASIGMTNMPKNPELLLKKIEGSLKAFAERGSAPKEECYLFVLESGEAVEGVSGLFGKTAAAAPEYFFQIEPLALPRFHAAVCKEMLLLHPKALQNGPSEICALFLARNVRKAGLGRLLSLSRFLFIASFPDRFEENVTALMRGLFDAENRSPFWEGVGRKFLDLDFVSLLRLREAGEGFVANILPRYPLYASLLTEEAQAAIGKVHPNTLPALAMLQHEGFTESRLIDFFDGGPQISAPKASIRAIRNSRTALVGALVTQLEGADFLISNERLDFRAIQNPLLEQGAEVTLTHEAAEALHVRVGERIRYVTAR